MKKLLIILFTFLISTNSYGGSADGKGLKCQLQSGRFAMNPIYIWFENGKFNIPYIKGSSISWKGYRYSESGSKYIYFDTDKFDTFFKYDVMTLAPFRFLAGAELDRSTLRLRSSTTFIVNGRQTGARYNCALLNYKWSIISELQEKIRNDSSTNKI